MHRTFALLAVLIFPAVLHAQWIPAAGEDASLPPPGTIRLGVSAGITVFDERFSRDGEGTREPLGADFSGDPLLADRLPSLLIAPERVRDLAGMPELTLSLGRVNVRLDSRVERLPISVEIGLLRRLAIGATVPVVRTWTNVTVVPGLGADALVGINPALLHPAALTQNAALVDAFTQSSAQLRERLDDCLGSSEPECDPVNQDRERAEALLAMAQAYGTNLSLVYLSSAVVPVASTPAEQAIAARIATIRAEFEAFGVGAFAGAPDRPVAATPLSHEDLQRFVTDPAFGIVGQPLARTERVSVGDVELGARLMLIDAMGRPDTADRAPGAGIRLTIGGLVRLPTGETASQDNFIDIGTGDGQRDVEGQALLDLFFARRFGISVASRYTRQLSHQRTMRIPEFPGQPFILVGRTQLVERDPGDIFQLEVKPRVAFGEYFAAGAYYLLNRKGVDRHSNPAPAAPEEVADQPLLDPSVLDVGTGFREQRLGFVLAFSSMGARARGRAWLPFELTYMHLRTVSGREGLVPIGREDRVQMRMYVPLWGR